MYLHVKYPSFVSDFKESCLSSTDIHMSYFMKICLVGAKLFHMDGWIDRQT